MNNPLIFKEVSLHDIRCHQVSGKSMKQTRKREKCEWKAHADEARKQVSRWERIKERADAAHSPSHAEQRELEAPCKL